MSVEIATLSKFVDNWRRNETPSHQLAHELATVERETNKKPDYHHYYLSGAALYSPITNRPVKQEVCRASEIDEIEYQIVEQIEKWAIQTVDSLREGKTATAIWFSPYHPLRSPEEDDTKITVYTLNNTGRLDNRAYMLKMPYQATTVYGNRLLKYSKNNAHFIYPEDLRGRLIILEDDIEWIRILEEVFDNSGIFESAYNDSDIAEQEEIVNQAYKYVAMIKNGVRISQIQQAMETDRFIGRGNISCNYVFSFFGINAIHSKIRATEGKYVEKCGKCGKVIRKVIKTGYKCSCGGIYEGC